MDKKEWVEAEKALEQLLPKIDVILVELDKAKNWGFWDLLGGGGLSGLIKRDKIYKANQKLDQLRLYLMDVQKELGDVNLTLTNIPDSNSVSRWSEDYLSGSIAIESRSINRFT